MQNSNITTKPQGNQQIEAGAAYNPAYLADLAAVVEAWPRLPEAIKAGILAMVQAADAER